MLFDELIILPCSCDVVVDLFRTVLSENCTPRPPPPTNRAHVFDLSQACRLYVCPCLKCACCPPHPSGSRPLQLGHVTRCKVSERVKPNCSLNGRNLKPVIHFVSLQVNDKPSTSSSSSASSPSPQRNFSRPVRPTKRRLPSRWASRSPTSSSASPSPCNTPVVPQFLPLQEHASSLTYSHAFHLQTAFT